MKKVILYIILTLLLFVTILGVPFVILCSMPFIMQDADYSKYIENLLAFGGSYWGGILGGICTLVGVVVTLKVSQHESMKPLLVVNFEEREIVIENPETYSQVNRLNGMMNYASLPLISDLCEIKVLNTGKGNAKDIDVTMLIRCDDAFLTDNNLRFLNLNRLPDDQVSVVNGNYVQKTHRTYISQENGECYLPINIALNGIIFSSIWNIAYCLNLDEKDFANNIGIYYKKRSTLPMTIPEIFILLEYSDLDDKRYHSLFRLGFSFVAQVSGGGIFIKPQLYYEKDSKRIRFKQQIKERKQREDKVTVREKRREEKLEIWRAYIYTAAMELKLTDKEASKICCDSSLRRYFYNYLKKGYAPKKELIVIFIYCCVDNSIKLCYSRTMFETILKAREKLIGNRKVRLFSKKDRQVISKQVKNELKMLMCNKDELYHVYFELYKDNSNQTKREIMVSKENFSIKIPIRHDLKMESGFYRVGYLYRMIENQKLVGSVIQSNYDNIEIGFFDERGIYYNGHKKWECIYLR